MCGGYSKVCKVEVSSLFLKVAKWEFESGLQPETGFATPSSVNYEN